jgi:arylsulfatase A-like enzyme
MTSPPQLDLGIEGSSPMSISAPAIETAGVGIGGRATTGIRLHTLVALSACCGLLSGLLEVGAIVVRKHTVDINQLYGMSREFVWLIPMTNLCIFVVAGVVCSLTVLIWPARGRWLGLRLLCALAILPPLLAAFPQIYAIAWLIVAVGLAARLVPVIERRGVDFGPSVLGGLCLLIGLVISLAGFLWSSDRIREWREHNQPLPPPNSPNLMLVVLDTVAANHLHLHGYERATSPTLDELARRGISFDRAQTAATWTLPSHASMFTGRWPHEFSANWLTPLDRAHPTLAEFLGFRGYATAGFVANTLYCAADSGLSRGFTTYRDYIFPRLTVFKSAALVHRFLAGLQVIEQFLEDRLDFDLLQPVVQRLWWQVNADRKDAAVVNREFLDWLSRRSQPERPFLAFLNYYDAHYPYQLPELSIRRFGAAPRDRRESDLIQDWWPRDKRGLSASEIGFVRDAYDDCIAHLDEQLGRLVDELDRLAVRDRTWVIIASDHGESFGEHLGVFCHGTSLYQTELHVPLVILPPMGKPAGLIVKDTVSLRDLAATIVDIAAKGIDSPFPGESLARFWDNVMDSSSRPAEVAPAGRALAEVVPNDPLAHPDRSSWREVHWPLAALTEPDWSYIRREGDSHEELFHLGDDPKETRNLAAGDTVQPQLARMRKELRQLTAGPLTPERFHP